MSAGSRRSRDNGFNFTLNLKGGRKYLLGSLACLQELRGEEDVRHALLAVYQGQAQLVYSRRLVRGTEHWLVSRLLVGAEHAYGNSSQGAIRRTVLHPEAPIQCVPSPCALSRRAATMRPRWMRTAISTRQVHSNSSSIRNTGSL